MLDKTNVLQYILMTSGNHVDLSSPVAAFLSVFIINSVELRTSALLIECSAARGVRFASSFVTFRFSRSV